MLREQKFNHVDIQTDNDNCCHLQQHTFSVYLAGNNKIISYIHLLAMLHDTSSNTFCNLKTKLNKCTRTQNMVIVLANVRPMS